jgi:phage tail tape-measure protein
MKREVMVGLVSVAMLLGGCATWNDMDRSEKGLAAGATGGAVIGRIVGGALGAAVGAGIGGYAGDHESRP